MLSQAVVLGVLEDGVAVSWASKRHLQNIADARGRKDERDCRRRHQMRYRNSRALAAAARAVPRGMIASAFEKRHCPTRRIARRIDGERRQRASRTMFGNAFDVVAERKQLDFEKIASGVYEVEYEVALRNHKTVPVSVDVNEPIGGTWRILRSTHEWTKSEAWAAQFVVPVPAEGAATLKYRVRVTY